MCRVAGSDDKLRHQGSGDWGRGAALHRGDRLWFRRTAGRAPAGLRQKQPVVCFELNRSQSLLGNNAMSPVAVEQSVTSCIYEKGGGKNPAGDPDSASAEMKCKWRAMQQ